MLPAFKGSRLKIERAIRHIAELEEIERRHTSIHPPNWEIEFRKTDSGTQIGFSCSTGPGDEQSSLIIGDAIHNLRSALDLMATDLARLRGETNPAKVYFPFSNSEDDLDKIIKQKNFHLTGDKAVDLVKTFKPYKGGNVALRAMHDLDIQDKHTYLIVQDISIESPSIVMGESGPEIAKLQRPQSASFLFPSGSQFAGRKIVPTLKELVQLTDGIVKAFEALALGESQQ